VASIAERGDAVKRSSIVNYADARSAIAGKGDASGAIVSNGDEIPQACSSRSGDTCRQVSPLPAIPPG